MLNFFILMARGSNSPAEESHIIILVILSSLVLNILSVYTHDHRATPACNMKLNLIHFASYPSLPT